MNRRQLLPKRIALLNTSELWLEDDHLLHVTSTRFTEKYARYRLADIQAIVWTRFPLWNPARTLWLFTSLFLTAILLLILPGSWKWASLPFAVSLVWAIVDVVQGPRCKVILHTAVSTVSINAAATVELAQSLLPELRQRIEQVQGQLSPDRQSVLPPAYEAQRNAPAPPKLSMLPQQILFGMLVAHAVLLAVLYLTRNLAIGPSLSATLLMAELSLGVIGGMRWRGLGALLAATSIVVAAFSVVDGGVLLYTLIQSFRAFFMEAEQGRRPERVAMLWQEEQTVFRAAWHAILGLVGWILMLERNSREKKF
jgi:hypothetical protein